MKTDADEALENTRPSKAVTGNAAIQEDTVNQEAKDKTRIFINDDKYDAPKPVMTGVELKALAGITAENHLFQDAPGNHEDPQIFDDMPFELRPGMKFYDVPAGNLGAR